MWPHESFRHSRRPRFELTDCAVLFVIGFSIGAALVIGFGWWRP